MSPTFNYFTLNSSEIIVDCTSEDLEDYLEPNHFYHLVESIGLNCNLDHLMVVVQQNPMERSVPFHCLHHDIL